MICRCRCVVSTGRPCRSRVYEAGEHYCLRHRDRYERLRIARYWKERREQKQLIAKDLGRHKPWREMRPLSDEEIYASKTAIVRGHGGRGVVMIAQADAPVSTPDHFYEDTTMLIREPAASNWPFGRNDPKVNRWKMPRGVLR